MLLDPFGLVEPTPAINVLYRYEGLERFIAAVAAADGVDPDGVEYVRVVDCTPDAIRAAGRIGTIDQSTHTFWIELSRIREDDEDIRWTLMLDPNEPSPRRARHLAATMADPFDHEWEIVRQGTAKLGADGVTSIART